MILVENLLNTLKKNKINFFSGVPDSILKNFCNSIEKLPKKKHVAAINEGSAASLGIGYYLSTKRIPCIYLQNSGLSNAINPLISIAGKEVYSIPLLLMIGWRGSPKSKDEPQHMAKGRITTKLLKLLKIEYCILRNSNDLLKLKKLIDKSKKNKKIIACLIEKDVLKSKNVKKFIKTKKNSLLRKDFIEEFLKHIPKNSKIISTTGYTSRELMQLRKDKQLKKGKDFYMVGGMGHSSMVSLGYSLQTNQIVFCLDGDGSILMHLGSLRTIGFNNNKKITHVLFNNNSHESVGGQATNADGIDFKNLVKSVGYRNYFKISKKSEIKNNIKKFIKFKGPSFLEVKISNGSLNNLERPKNLNNIKQIFMKK